MVDTQDLACTAPLHESNRSFANIRRDFWRYIQQDCTNPNPGFFGKLRLLIESPGLQAVLVYRFGAWVYRSVHFPLFKIPLKLLYYVLQKLCIICWGIFIDPGAQVGGGLYLGHFGGILIGPAKMGRDCNVSERVTIGRRAKDDTGVPTFGNQVWIGTGSVVFGGIQIGDGVTIGPLTIVARNLPPRVFVMGNPMRLIRKNYDNSVEVYGVPKERK